MIRIIFLSLIFSLSLLIQVLADGLDNLGIYSNINRPEIWQDQLGGFATGGSIYVRAPTTNLELMTLDMPSFDAGCGGIDAYFGGFGYINSQQLQKLIKNIGSNALAYGVSLTIKSLSPTVSDLLENLESMARFINSQNINSCQMGASIASGLFPKNEQSQRLACQARKMDGANQVSNYFTSRYECNDAANMQQTNAAQEKAMLPPEYNLVWYALNKEAENLALSDKEFLMSLSGTIIAKTRGVSIGFEHKNSLTIDANILAGLLFGSDNLETKIYRCDEESKCLHPKTVMKQFRKEDCITNKVAQILDSISDKIINESGGQAMSLSADEKDIVSKTSIPILKLISLNAANKGHGVQYVLEDYTEAIAFDYVIGYLDSLLDFVYRGLSVLEHNQIDGKSIKDFKQEMRHLKKLLFNERMKAFERLNTLLSVKQRTQQLETIILSSFSGLLDTSQQI